MLLVTQAAHLMCLCICSHKWAKIVFFLFRLHTSPNNRRRLLLERRVTLLKYLVLQYTNRASKNWDDYREHECATDYLLCITVIVVLCKKKRIYSNFTAELYTHKKWCSTTYLRNKKKCWVVQPTSI
jgi:hypothetical protein